MIHQHEKYETENGVGDILRSTDSDFRDVPEIEEKKFIADVLVAIKIGSTMIYVCPNSKLSPLFLTIRRDL